MRQRTSDCLRWAFRPEGARPLPADSSAGDQHPSLFLAFLSSRPGGADERSLMSSTWTQNFYHLVFATKRREPLIDAALEERLHPFLGGICRDLSCTAVAMRSID